MFEPSTLAITEKEAKVLQIIHLTQMKPMGASAKLVPGLVQKGFCTEGGKRSKLTDAGYNALIDLIKSKEGL